MAFLERFSPRERWLVLAAGAVVMGFVLWLAAWRPLVNAQARVAAQIEAQSVDLEWLRAAAWEADRLKVASPKAAQASRGNVSLLALAEQTARANGLASAFRRGEPAGTGKVRIWLEGAAFDRMMVWLEDVEQTYAISVEDGSLERAGVPGLVNARLLLAEP